MKLIYNAFFIKKKMSQTL